MSNAFMNGLKAQTNYTLTENGALAHRSTLDALQDLYGLGAAYRGRSDEDCIHLFKKAFDENETYAMKCLFYLRDVRGGQGERRFFRVVMRWLASYNPQAVLRNLQYIPEFGRYDDLYCLIGTPMEDNMWEFLKSEIAQGITILEAIKDE